MSDLSPPPERSEPPVLTSYEKLIARIVDLKELEVGDHRMARRWIAWNYDMREAWQWPEERVREFIRKERRHLEALR